MFPSPCGVLVVKRSTSFHSDSSDEHIVSVPLRGFGSETSCSGPISVYNSKKVSVPLRGFGSETHVVERRDIITGEVSVPLRGFGSETKKTMEEQNNKRTLNEVSVPLRGFGSETFFPTNKTCEVNGKEIKFPSPCGVLVVKPFTFRAYI